jgi:hypothetical protein
MTKARDIADFKFEDIVDTGTEGTKVATGTTAQRGSTQGQYRYNTTTGFFEGYNGTDFVALAPTPTISSVSPTDIESAAGGNVDIVIQGTNFDTNTTAKFIANDNSEFSASSVSFNSSTQITATVAKSSFQNSKEPYDVKVTASSGLSATLDNSINVDNAPTFSTASGSLGSGFEGDSYSFTVSATDAEGDTVSYSLQSGALPSGGSLNSSTGAITGTHPTVSSNTTDTFTIRATAGSKTTDREFSILTKNATTNIYTSSGSFTISSAQAVKVYVIGGGGGGGGEGGSDTLSSNEEYGGGGGGGMAYKLFPNLSAGTYNFTVGSGGSGGSRDASPTAGGTSSITLGGVTLQATGGGAGGTDNVTGGGYTIQSGHSGRGSFGGAGGVGSGGDVNGTGGKGGAGADDYTVDRTYTTTSAYEAGDNTSAGKDGINGGAGGGGAGSEANNDFGAGSVTIAGSNHGGNGSSTYFTGGGGGGGIDGGGGYGTNGAAGGSGYTSGGQGSGDSSSNTAADGGGSVGGSKGVSVGTGRGNAGGGGGSHGGGGGGGADPTNASGNVGSGSGGGGAVVVIT